MKNKDSEVINSFQFQFYITFNKSDRVMGTRCYQFFAVGSNVSHELCRRSSSWRYQSSTKRTYKKTLRLKVWNVYLWNGGKSDNSLFTFSAPNYVFNNILKFSHRTLNHPVFMYAYIVASWIYKNVGGGGSAILSDTIQTFVWKNRQNPPLSAADLRAKNRTSHHPKSKKKA
jgi:hypothetical protein